jgi:hypothetical protein
MWSGCGGVVSYRWSESATPPYHSSLHSLTTNRVIVMARPPLTGTPSLIAQPTRCLPAAAVTRLRPDAHTAVRHGGGKLPPDCLHLALPGVPDVWNALLLGAIDECG